MNVSLQQEPVVATIAELDLRPEVHQRLDAMLSTYATLAADLALLQEAADLEKSKIGKLLADHGYDKARTEDFALTWVRGSTTSTLDKQKLLAEGVTLAQMERATITKPRKDYFQIRQSSKKEKE